MIQMQGKKYPLKSRYTTIDSLRSYKEYKSLGSQLSIHLLDVCRPKFRNIAGLEIMVNLYLYFITSTDAFAKDRTVYGLNFLFTSAVGDRTFGGTAAKIKERLHNIFLSLILDDTHSLPEWEAWRKCTPSSHMSVPYMGFPHYRNTASMPIHLDFAVDGLLNMPVREKFEWHPNSSWKGKAVKVVGKYFKFVTYPGDNNQHFLYCINYSTTYTEGSSWEVVIMCEPNETFVDFVARLQEVNFLTQEGRDKLQPTEEGWKYYRLME